MSPDPRNCGNDSFSYSCFNLHDVTIATAVCIGRSFCSPHKIKKDRQFRGKKPGRSRRAKKRIVLLSYGREWKVIESNNHHRYEPWTSWPMWMPSANWTAIDACSNGKPRPAATRKSRADCWPWILSWFAIPASRGSPMWLKSCLSANDWSRFSIT